MLKTSITKPMCQLVLLAIAGLSSGCYSDSMSQRGFYLPDGDSQSGKDAFLNFQCNQCHTVQGESLPTIPGSEPYVDLGGKVTRIKSYGELLTAVIDPSHDLADGYAEQVVSEDGESNMYNYNAYMTVQQLIDIVSFLQPHYDVFRPEVE